MSVSRTPKELSSVTLATTDPPPCKRTMDHAMPCHACHVLPSSKVGRLEIDIH